jgi:hypothetical protein
VGGEDIVAICLFEELAHPWDAQKREMMRSGQESGINEKTELFDNHAG